jgi:TRAP-type C4-dicarboxylate transport system permease small subunit
MVDKIIQYGYNICMKILKIVCIIILVAFSILLMGIIYSGINFSYDENGIYFENGIVYHSITYIYFSLLLLIVILILFIIFILKIIKKLKQKKKYLLG